MEFTEEDASALARLCEEKKAQIGETRCLLARRSRHLMEQSALLQHDIDTFKNDLAAVGIQDCLTGVSRVCACAPLCPAVWSMLPVELLQCVFSWLPLPDIIRLRVLSRTWDKYVTGVTPGFTKLCAEQNHNMFALIKEGSRIDDSFIGPMVVKSYASEEKRWHRFVHDSRDIFDLDTESTMFAGDGGLVCLVSRLRNPSPWGKGRLVSIFPSRISKIVVCNPLTRQWRKLPSTSSLSRLQPRMVQLVMDRDSKCYKVLVVGSEEHCGDDTVSSCVFSSSTGKWSVPNIFSDLIFGCLYSSVEYSIVHGVLTGKETGPCALDCASNTLLEFQDGSYPGGSRDSSVEILVKDRLFVLHKNSELKYLLTEYQAQICRPHWVRLKIHQCFELDEVSRGQGDVELKMRLFGCRDFLVVIAYEECDEDAPQIPKRTLLFDLSTSQWQLISEFPEWGHEDYADDCMIELRWDAIP